MPKRKIVFANDEIYHITNRGVLRKPIFTDNRDYSRFVETLDFYRYSYPPLRFSFYQKLEKSRKNEFLQNLKDNHKPIVDILVYCLMPNHFHILLRQLVDKGITSFMKNTQTSYALYFNTKHKQEGHLFKSAFNAIRIENDNILLHIARYIHLNPVSAYLIELGELENYQWSSFPDYLNPQKKGFVNTSQISSHFSSVDKYKEFVYNQADYQKTLQFIKNSTSEK